MRPIVLASAIVPALAVPVLVLVLTSAGQQPRAPVAAGGRGHAVSAAWAGSSQVVIDCGGRGTVRPATFQLACADENDYLSGLHWSAWRRGYAAAAGTQTMNDCVPSCAVGTFRSYRVRVVLSGNAAISGHSGQHRYQTITLSYPGRLPLSYSGTGTVHATPSRTQNLRSSAASAS